MVDNIATRQIRIFISSTFKDMELEREFLIRKTFPRLKRLASLRDVTLTEVDLRWGIPEEDAKSGRVVELCLKEIENSIPFFIGIIGNRYGWCPTEQDICDSNDMNDRFRWVHNDIKNGLSVTEMEMQYGVLRREEEMNACFYIKSGGNISECDSPEQLASLKAAVRSNGRYPVYDYSVVEELSEYVEKEFNILLDKYFPNSQNTEQERESALQRCIVRQLCEGYVANDDELSHINSFISNGCTQYLTLYGPIGIGKSALLANWIKSNVDNEKYNIAYFFTQGANNVGCDYVIEHLVQTLRKQCSRDIPNIKPEQGIVEISNLSKKPTVIILDGIEPFQKSDNWEISSLSWLPKLSTNCKIILSSSYSSQSFSEYEKDYRGITEATFTVRERDYSQKKIIITKYLEKYRKRLTEQQTEKIASFNLASNPRILTTLLSDLICNCRFETLDSSIEGFTNVASIKDFYLVIINHLESNFGEKLVKGVLMLTAIPIFGLTEHDIISILSISKFEWYEIYCAFSNYLGIYNGRIRFADNNFSDAVLDYYKQHYSNYQERMILYLNEKLKSSDIINIKSKIWEELCEQYFHKEDAEGLFNLISDFEVFRYLTYKRAAQIVSINGAKQIYRYWEWLFSVNPHKYNLGVYLSVAGTSPEAFLKDSSELTDVAIHSEDYLSILKIVFRIFDLLRQGNVLEEKDYTYFEGELGLASLSCDSLGLLKFARNFDIIRAKGTIPQKKPIWEKSLRWFLKSNDIDDIEPSIQAFDKAVSYIHNYKTYRRDLCIIKTHIAQKCCDAQDYSRAETIISEILYEVENIKKTSYDDRWECYIAQLMGKQVHIKIALKKYDEALDMCEKTIIRWEDIEDWRLEYGSFRATIDEVQHYADIYDEIMELKS